MDTSALKKISEVTWQLEPQGNMQVPAILYADQGLLADMDDKVLQQLANVASLPGIVNAAWAMPDAHWGYGFPIGGVAAFDPQKGGIISGGGVGFDISCGVRTLHTGLKKAELGQQLETLANQLYYHIPAGLGSTGAIHLKEKAMEEMLAGGARWAVRQGYGLSEDLDRIEDRGCINGAKPELVSALAKERQSKEMGTLGSGNHYLELQEVVEIRDSAAAQIFGLAPGDLLLSIHCGSRGLGHQIGTDYLRDMLQWANRHHLALPDRELACAPLDSDIGQAYLGAMRAGINCALANRQILTHLAREVFARVFPRARLQMLYDVSHNTCREEKHEIRGKMRTLFVHRKGATRALPPGHPELPAALGPAGQPVLIGGSMGTASYILAGKAGNEEKAFSSACHGAGRKMSRHQATRQWKGEKVVADLQYQGIYVRSPSMRGVAEEAPGAYKDPQTVVEAAEAAGLAGIVARLRPLACIKG